MEKASTVFEEPKKAEGEPEEGERADAENDRSANAGAPLGKLTLILRGDERGYAIFLSDRKEAVHAMNIKTKDSRICGEQFQFYEGSVVNMANSEMRKEGFFAHSHVCE